MVFSYFREGYNFRFALSGCNRVPGSNQRNCDSLMLNVWNGIRRFYLGNEKLLVLNEILILIIELIEII